MMKKIVVLIISIMLGTDFVYSQHFIRVSEVTFSDEELQYKDNDTSGNVVLIHSFLKRDSRYLFLVMEVMDSIELDDSPFNLYVSFKSSNDTIPLICCDRVCHTDTSSIIHTFCAVSEEMIPGGRKFLLEDVRYGYDNLRDTLYKNVECFYSMNKGELHKIDLPCVNIVCPIISESHYSDAPYIFRRIFCPDNYSSVYDNTGDELFIDETDNLFMDEDFEHDSDNQKNINR